MFQTLYFAYGSNLNREQMRARCPAAREVGPATLPGHAIVFGGWSGRWRGAVANVIRSRRSTVCGVLYSLSKEDVLSLDVFEGHPFVYQRVALQVVDSHGKRHNAVVYRQHPAAFQVREPSVSYLCALWREYLRLGFNCQPLLNAAGMST